MRHFVNAALAAEGAPERVPLLLGPADIAAVVGDSLAMDPMTLVFWAIALYAAWRYAAPAAPADEYAQA
jgi:hypothetical protein